MFEQGNKPLLRVRVVRLEPIGPASKVGKLFNVWKINDMFYFLDDASLPPHERLVHIDSVVLTIAKNVIGGELI